MQDVYFSLHTVSYGHYAMGYSKTQILYSNATLLSHVLCSEHYISKYF